MSAGGSALAMTTRDGHRPTPEAVAVIYAFFEHFLKPQKPESQEK